MDHKQSCAWFTNFLGIAYRYFDIRMNVILLFSNNEDCKNTWNRIMNQCDENEIKIRFVENQNHYWFIMTLYNNTKNVTFYKDFLSSHHYNRFKTNYDGKIYLRFGTYKQKYQHESKYNDICNCNHIMEKHDYNKGCKITTCVCTKFVTFQITLIKKKKVISDVKFLKTLNDVKKDSIAWNCLYYNNIID